MTKKPAGATVVKPDAAANKDEEGAGPATTAKPAAAKKKPAAAAKPAAARSEPAEEKREPRAPKVNLHRSSVAFHAFLLFVARASSSLRHETYKHIHMCLSLKFLPSIYGFQQNTSVYMFVCYCRLLCQLLV